MRREMRFESVVLAAGVVLVGAGLVGGCGEAADPPGEASPGAVEDREGGVEPEVEEQEPELVLETRSVEGWDVQIRWDTDRQARQRVEIAGEDGVVWSLAGHRLSLGSGPRGDGEGEPRIGIGEDVTGDGVSNLVIRQWTGENGCCVRYAVLAVDGEEVREIAALEGGRLGAFADVDGDGRAEFITADRHWEGWRATAEHSPEPQLIYKYTGDGYELSASLMRAPAPSEDSLEQRAEVLGDDPDWDDGEPPPAYWGALLELLYTGHEDAAWRLAMRAWPEGVEGRDEFLTQLRHHLEEGPAWPVIEEIGRGG